MKRLQYSIPDEQWKLIEELAKAFALDTKTVLAFSTSIGLRFLDVSLVHPLAGLGRAIEERGELVGAEVLADVEMTKAQGTFAKPLAKRRDVAGDSNQAVWGKAALKGPLLVKSLLPCLADPFIHQSGIQFGNVTFLFLPRKQTGLYRLLPFPCGSVWFCG